MTSQTVDPPTLKNLGQSFPQLLRQLPVVGSDPTNDLQTQGWGLAKLAGDASSRSYYRLSNSHTGDSYVLQVSEAWRDEDSLRHPFLAAQSLLAALSLPAPRIEGLHPKRGWILLEDLGDETLQTHPSRQLYREAIDMLVNWTLRARPDNPELAAHRQAPHFAWAFDVEKLDFEMNHTAHHLVEKLLGQDGAKFKELVAKNTEYLAARPRFFCHRDYHCRNLMVHHGRAYLIDFQDARMGPLSYDIVSLLWDPYVSLSAGDKRELLDLWREQLVTHARESGLPALPPEDWRVELERMKVQRLLKAAGSYASFLVLKGRRDYLPSIAPALRDTAEALEELAKLGVQTSADAELLTWVQGVRDSLPAILKVHGVEAVASQ